MTGDELEVIGEDRPRVSRARLVVAASVAAAVVATVALMDRRDRAAEEAQLDACVARAVATGEQEYARVAGIADYVRVVATGDVERGVLDDVLQLVSDSALRAPDRVAGVRRSCAALDIGALHSDLDDRRDACVASLDLLETFFRDVVADGSAVFRESPPLPVC